MNASQPNLPAVLAPFLDHWFRGFNQGLDQLDSAARTTLLRACGRACSRSYTLGVYREAWARSSDLSSFVARLGERFRGADYRLVDDSHIEVKYYQCTCDLVTAGWIRTAALCECSVHSLAENFGEAMQTAVKVELHSSILAGDPHCRLVVSIG